MSAWGERAMPPLRGRNIDMSYFGPLLISLVVAWVAACGNDENNPVATTPSPDPPDDAPTVGVLVFSSGDVRTTTQWGTDDYALNTAVVRGDTLAVSVSYSGGCETHRFTLVAAEVLTASDPVQFDAALAHEANGDACEAYLTEDYHFLLNPLKVRYKSVYGTGPGTLVLALDRAPGGPLVYAFD